MARNSGGEISSTIHLSMKRRFEASVIPDVQTVDVGQRATFRCKLSTQESGEMSFELLRLG